MQSRNFVSFTLSLVLIHLAVSYAANNVTSTNATTSGATVVQTTTIPTTVTSTKPSDASSQQQVTNTTGKPATGDDDCSDEEPSAEPERAANNGTNREGKQLTLNDKDKYTHEGGKAEPEPESEPNSNSTSATGKLTGNSTTARPAAGGASTIVSEFTCGLGALTAAVLWMRAASTNI